ncbi:GHKL domain-containing protein [Bacillus weihaiensis]|uniref:GHKL domain-containing protein n=1 Tax=Bacillus weihaiensis TaxID=1547283 RepID=UPI0023557FDC|nr:GHKL domain-containing protein [Bacillus weihaiensis]
MKTNKIKLIISLSIILFLFFTGLNMYMSYINIRQTVESSVGERSLEAAISIANSMDVETYKRFLNNPVENEEYWKIRHDLNDAREKIGALYVYTLAVDNPKVSYGMIVGLPPGTKEEYPIGVECTVPEQQVKEAYEGNTFITKSIYDSTYDVTYISVGAPIKDKENQIIGFLGIDMNIDTLKETRAEVLKNSLAIFAFNGFLVLAVVLSFLFMQRWYQKVVIEEVASTEDIYQAELKGLIASVSSVRHDFINHVQVLHGLLKIGHYEQALEYAASLSHEVKTIETLHLDIEHPGLSVFLQTKKLSAQNYQIDMDLSISDSQFEKIKTLDLIKILANLVDNAIEATILLPEEQRRVKITCHTEHNYYYFIVKNTGPKIKNKEQIFDQGYSTKALMGKTRGQGLFIVKEIVHQYNGTIEVDSTDRETMVKVMIPIQ